MLNRLPSLFVGACLLSVSCFPPVRAQDAAAPTQEKTERWAVGATVQSISPLNAPGVRVGGHVSWRFAEHWGVQTALRYAFAGKSSDQGLRVRRRHVEGAVSLFWQPVLFSTGSLNHALRVQTGPAIQGGRTHWDGNVGFICATGLSEAEIEAMSNRYPDSKPFANVGVHIGLGYGVTYRALTVRAMLSGGKLLGSRYRLSSGRRAVWTVGRGISVSVRL